MCQCFTPAMFKLTENTRVEAEENHGTVTKSKRKRGTVAMLMEEMEREEMEQEPKRSPDGTTTDLSAGAINCRDWLAVIYDQNWWLAKAVIVDARH